MWIVQLKEVEPLALVESVAVTVTFDVPVRLGTPEIKPVDELIDRPLGRLEADHRKLVRPPESVACIWRLTDVERLVD